MKKLVMLFILVFCGLCACGHAQCVVPVGFVCITQEDANKAGQAAIELKASMDVIAKFKAERLTTDAERTAFQTLVKSWQDVADTRGKMIIEYEHMQDLWKKAFDLQAMIIESLTNQLNKPKSGFQKLVAALEKVLYIAAGVAFGRGL